MPNKRGYGFTLIELLIVVAIVGILAALLIPNAIPAMQKAKQKQTMKDIISIITAAVDYATDNGEAPDSGSQSGALQAGSVFAAAIVPVYIKSCPMSDQWGNPFLAYSGSAVSGVYDIEADEVGADDIIVASNGRGGEDDGWVYNPNNPISGWYVVINMSDFSNDLINMNGSWLRGPRSSDPGT